MAIIKFFSKFELLLAIPHFHKIVASHFSMNNEFSYETQLLGMVAAKQSSVNEHEAYVFAAAHVVAHLFPMLVVQVVLARHFEQVNLAGHGQCLRETIIFLFCSTITELSLSGIHIDKPTTTKDGVE